MNSGTSVSIVLLLLLVSVVPGTPKAQSEKSSKWWATEPVQNYSPPAVRNSAWCKNEIDHHILASMEKVGLVPSTQADKRTLLRRITIDLNGITPTPGELDDFLNDKSTNAFEKVVDRLLASPRYGERMARRWLDLVHYAESHGHDEDKHRPHAWPYRDYLIRAFNSDLPYRRFIEEQIAGDVLFPDQPDGIIALGMLAAGPWDQSSQMGIMDGTLDKQVARYLDRDDMITTVMSTFTSTTVHCARCHDHKFDPISLNDYYSLQAVFAGVDRTNRPYDNDPVISRQREQLNRQLREARRTSLEDIRWTTAQARQIAADWEASQTRWTTLAPMALYSSGGATLLLNQDLSLSSTGKRPDVDSTIVVGTTQLKTIKAVRLELLTDPSLPQHGPGRHENGNLHLSEIDLSLCDPHKSRPEHHVKWKRAISDFNQSGWSVSKAIDGNLKTAWGIFPQVGKPHVAIFELSDPLTVPQNWQIHITLTQNHGAGHLLGRFRLSVTDGMPNELEVTKDKLLSDALAVDAASRSKMQTSLIAREAECHRLNALIRKLPEPKLVFAVTSHFPADGNFKPAEGPRPVHVLRRGDIKYPLRPAQPGALSCISTLSSQFTIADNSDEGQRRAALAKWLAHSDNPLTWRSIANRLWQWHFGKGLVESANDFGNMGSRPSHPELLDWIAHQLRTGHSLKTLHRLMVTSATYRQSATINPAASSIDPDNKLLTFMPRSRLDAESLRDSILQTSGKLDNTMYGPSIKHFTEKPGIHVTPLADYDRFNLDGPGSFRRSIYRFVFRTVPDPLLDALDCPDGSQLTPKRNATSTPLQALTLLHHPFMIRMSEHIADRIQGSCTTPELQISDAFKLILLRQPSNQEIVRLTGYLKQYGLASVCRLLLNTNEFHFID